MPNHVVNRLTVLKGEYDLSALHSFDALVAMPSELGVPHDNVSWDVDKMLGLGANLFSQDRPSIDDLYFKYGKKTVDTLLANYLKFGSTTWYGWRIKNWGTKWDMYSRVFEEGVLKFETAWSAPLKVYEELSKSLPDGVEIKVEFASEDIGSHVGVLLLKKEGVDKNAYRLTEEQGVDLAMSLHGYHLE